MAVCGSTSALPGIGNTYTPQRIALGLHVLVSASISAVCCSRCRMMQRHSCGGAMLCYDVAQCFDRHMQDARVMGFAL